MRYRIRTDLIFAKKSEADEVWSDLKRYLRTKDIRNVAEEKSYIDYHLCGHDEGKTCIPIEHFSKE